MHGIIWLRTQSLQDGQISFAPTEPPPSLDTAREHRKCAIDFGFAISDGAGRVQRTTDGLCVTPLPGSTPCAVRLRLAAFGVTAAKQVLSESRSGEQRQIPVTLDNGVLPLRHDGVSFRYLIVTH